jgi:protein-S-isoprenylcysteine O-methyltransferase Ste14
MPLPLRALIFVVAVPGTIAGLLPWLLATRGEGLPLGALRWPPPPWHLLGWLPLAAGLTTYLGCVWEFVARGRGTPAPWDAPRRVVAGGLYRFVRNPMYLTVAVLLVGEALLYRAPVVLLLVAGLWALFHAFVVRYEEPALLRRFGAEYEDYRRRVPRWVPCCPRRADSDPTRPAGRA